MRAIVTGSCGFVGRHLIQLLRDAGYEVIGIDPKNEDINHRKCRFEWWVKSCFPEVWEPYDVFIHLAANIESIDEREKGDIVKYRDIVLDYSVAEFIARNSPRECYVWPSSCATDTPETDPYSWVKLAGERMALALHKQGVPVVILRPFSGTGLGQSLSYPMPSLIKQAAEKRNPLIIWGSLETQRDWLYIEDFCRAILWSIKRFPRGIPVDVGSGIGTSFGDLARIIADKAGYNPQIVADTSKPSSSLKRIANTELAKAHGFETRYNVEQIVEKCLKKWPW